MRNRFEKQLEQLNNHLLEMGALIERSIENATQALIRQDVDAANAAIAADQEIDHKEKEIESLCLKLILQQQPVAKDLRLISAALKMITDMERIGDQAADISGIVCYIADQPYIKELEHLPRMGKQAIAMVKSTRSKRPVPAKLNLVEPPLPRARIVWCSSIISTLYKPSLPGFA